MSRPGEFEVMVLLAALHLGAEEAYAVSIAREIETRTSRSVRRGNVYTALRRLERKGLVEASMSDPRPERGGKSRRLVALTREGRAVLAETTTDLLRMLEGLDDALGGLP